MLLMAHAGIAVGAAYLIEQAVNLINSGLPGKTAYRSKPLRDCPAADNCDVKPASASQAVNKVTSNRHVFQIDYRFILLGSILPDLIDKPIGVLLSPIYLTDGRLITHTLIFLIIAICIGGFIAVKQRKLWGLYIIFGLLVHLALDSMWLEPVVLLWPAVGFGFPQTQGTGWTAWILEALRTWRDMLFLQPQTYIPEITGSMILMFFAVRIIIRKRIKEFIYRGSI
jgi:inner membrane protein